MFVVYRTGTPLDLEPGHHGNDNKGYRSDAHHWLAAIDIATGLDVHPPVEILGENFEPNMQLNRPGLLLDAGTVYVAFGAAVCDVGGNPYRAEDSQSHGWVFAYDARNMSQKAIFTTANGTSAAANHDIIAGIWQSGNGLASDSQGNIYAFTGNNNVPNKTSVDLSESIIRLKLPAGQSTNKFQVASFQVHEAADLDMNGNDGDLGAGGPVFPFDNVLIGGGKQGVLYSMRNPAAQWPPVVEAFQAFYNTWDDLQLRPARCNPQNTLPVKNFAAQAVGPNIHGSPVVFKPAGADFAYVYAMPEKDYVRAFKVSSSGNVDRCPAMTTEGQAAPGSREDLRSPRGMPGGFLSISANIDHDGIVWASVPCIKNSNGQDCPVATNTFGEINGRLIAFDALTLKKLWEDQDETGGHPLVPFAKFVPPTVAGGNVFRAAYKDRVYVYGLKSTH